MALALLSSRIKEGHQGLKVANVETSWYSTLVITITEKDPKRVREGGKKKKKEIEAKFSSHTEINVGQNKPRINQPQETLRLFQCVKDA